MSSYDIHDITDKIIDFEAGELSHSEIINLFSTLIKTHILFQLQGYYQRYARDLLLGGYINRQGDILKYENEDD